MPPDLHRLKPPITLTIGADIPPGSEIAVFALTQFGPKRFAFVTGAESHTLIYPVTGLSYELTAPPPPNLAFPFLRFIQLDSRFDRVRLSAEILYQDQPGLLLCKPKDEESYLAQSYFGSELVVASDVGRPWRIRADGYAPGDSSLLVQLGGRLPSGDVWSCDLGSDLSTEIDPVALAALGVSEVRLNASSDGTYSPTLHGIYFEGDQRSHFIPIHALIHVDVPEHLWLQHGEGFSILMLQPILPKFSEAPSVIDRIRILEQEGKLRPRAVEGTVEPRQKWETRAGGQTSPASRRMSWSSPIYEFYAAAHRLVEKLSFRAGASNRAAQPITLAELGREIANGTLKMGDRVCVKGFLSPLANWYLPESYSPYRFHTDYAVRGFHGALRLYPAPSFLPVGELPFKHEILSLGFLYPSDSSRFAIELGEVRNPNLRDLQRDFQSPDDQPFFLNLEGVANFSENPFEMIYFMGDNRLQALLPEDPPSVNNILTDPAKVRDVVQVPDSCAAFPVVYPRGSLGTRTDAVVTGTIGELDDSAVQALSILGDPMAGRAFRLFHHPSKQLPPLCIYADPLETRTAESALVRTVPLTAEFCFLDSSGRRLPFGDDELAEVLLPEIKDFTYPVDAVLLPDRWTGKVYGFNGPIYVYKTGPIELWVSTDGSYFASTVAGDSETQYGDRYGQFQQFVTILSRRLEQRFSSQRSETIRLAMTFMTSRSWQMNMGPLLEGVPSPRKALVLAPSASALRSEVQDEGVDDKAALLAPMREALIRSDIPNDAEWLEWFGIARHNNDLLPLTKKLFESLGYPSFTTHDPRDHGTDNFVTVSQEPKLLVSVQIKSHSEMFEERLNDTVLAQRSRSSSYEAALYLILVYANPLSEKRKGPRTEGEMIESRFAELKRQLQLTAFRADTEIVSPQALAHTLRELGLAPSAFTS